MFIHELIKGLDNAPDATKIRDAVFVEEQCFKEEYDFIDTYAHHLIIYSAKTPVATGRTFPKSDDPSTYIIGRIAVMKAYRGQGLGEQAVKLLEAYAAKAGATHVQLSAQIAAKDFYAKLGYKESGDIYYEEHCPHISMKKELI